MCCATTHDLVSPVVIPAVLGGSIANCVHASALRHPYADRPIVDWDLIVITETLTVAGAVLGSFTNFILPGAVITILLLVVLSWAGSRTFKKGKQE